MNKNAVYVIFFCLGVLAFVSRAQDVAPLATSSGETTVVNMAPPSSVRYNHTSTWYTDLNPGVEGALGLPSDDSNHIYVWHLNHWRSFTLQTSIQ